MGKGGSRQSTATSNATQTSNEDRRLVVAEGALGITGNGSSVALTDSSSNTTTDFGAIQEAMEFVGGANAMTAGLMDKMLKTTERNTDIAVGAAEGSKALTGTIALVAIVGGLYVLQKKRGA